MELAGETPRDQVERHHVHGQKPELFLDFGPMASIAALWAEPSHHGTDALSKLSPVILA